MSPLAAAADRNGQALVHDADTSALVKEWTRAEQDHLVFTSETTTNEVVTQVPTEVLRLATGPDAQTPAKN